MARNPHLVGMVLLAPEMVQAGCLEVSRVTTLAVLEVPSFLAPAQAPDSAPSRPQEECPVGLKAGLSLR